MGKDQRERICACPTNKTGRLSYAIQVEEIEKCKGEKLYKLTIYDYKMKVSIFGKCLI